MVYVYCGSAKNGQMIDHHAAWITLLWFDVFHTFYAIVTPINSLMLSRSHYGIDVASNVQPWLTQTFAGITVRRQHVDKCPPRQQMWATHTEAAPNITLMDTLYSHDTASDLDSNLPLSPFCLNEICHGQAVVSLRRYWDRHLHIKTFFPAN